MVSKIRDLECLIATNQQRTRALVQSPPTSCTLPCTRQATFKLQQTKQVGDQCLVPPEMSRHHNVLEVNLPSHRNLTATVVTLLNGHTTESVIDSATMVTLVQESLFSRIFCPKDFGPVCVLTGIGEESVHGQLVHNFPFSVGSQTFLHTVCVAPIKDKCLIGLDFLTATGRKLDLAKNVLKISGERVPVIIEKSPAPIA